MKHYRNLLYIGFIILLAYSPVASFLFALKNDFFTQYFPQRFFIGESVHNGMFPLWNPYINYGIPVFADMNAGFWYPFTWLNALLTGYNAYSFTIEELLHIVIAGAGMYWLTGHWDLKPQARIIAAVSYACSGFITGQLQHFNWITGATWLPWCTRALLRYYAEPLLKSLIPAIIFFSLLLTGSHPGIIIGALYFFLIITVVQLIRKREKKAWIAPVVLLISLLILASGMVYSYGEMFSLFTRSSTLSAREIQLNAVDNRSFLSILFPLSSVKSAHDIALQNIYMGISMFLSAIAGVFYFRSSKTFHFLFIGIFFFLISSDLPFSTLLLDHLPILNYVRLNAEFRVFGILSLIIFAADSFDHLYNKKPELLIRLYLVSAVVSFICLVPYLMSDASGLFSRIAGIRGQQGIKDFIDQLAFSDTMLINLFTLAITSLASVIILVKKKEWFLHLAVIDLVIATWLTLPFTGIGMRSVEDIQVLVSGSPHGFPKPVIKAENALVAEFPQTDKTIGNWSMYSKQIAIKEWFPYPILLDRSSAYFDRDHLKELAQQKPFIFSASGHHDYRITRFKPSLIVIEDRVTHPGNLVIKQNYYPGWKTYINDQAVTRNELYGPFPSIPLLAGKQNITHRFEKPFVTITFILFAVGFCLMIWYQVISSGTFFRSRL